MRLLFFALSLLLVLACNKQPAGNEVVDTPPAPTPQSRLETTAVEDPTIYRTTVDELRLRESGDSKSRVIAKLPRGQKLISLEEASTETFTATLGGRKVTDVWRKVKLPEQKDGKDVIGWTFGGALKEEVITYDPLPDGRYERMFEEISPKEMSRILGLDTDEYKRYSGRISYRKTPTGLYLKDGQFEVVGTMKIEEAPDETFTDTFVGQFVDDKLDGKIIRYVYGYESKSEATIFFRNGNCEWGYMREEGEGVIMVSDQKKMGTCTFTYLIDGLVEVSAE